MLWKNASVRKNKFGDSFPVYDAKYYWTSWLFSRLRIIWSKQRTKTPMERRTLALFMIYSASLTNRLAIKTSFLCKQFQIMRTTECDVMQIVYVKE